MKITFDQSQFDGACAFLAQRNPIFGGDPDKVAASMRESLKRFADMEITYTGTGGYVILAVEDEGSDLSEEERHVEILVNSGVCQPYEPAEFEV